MDEVFFNFFFLDVYVSMEYLKHIVCMYYIITDIDMKYVTYLM